MAEEQQPAMTAAGLKTAYDEALSGLESKHQNELHELTIKTREKREKITKRYVSEKKEAYLKHNPVTAFLITGKAAYRALVDEERLKELSEAERTTVDTRFHTAMAIASDVYVNRLFDYEKKLGREISELEKQSASLNREKEVHLGIKNRREKTGPLMENIEGKKWIVDSLTAQKKAESLGEQINSIYKKEGELFREREAARGLLAECGFSYR